MNKKYPERKCIGCGTRKPKSDLVRVVRTPDGSISLDKKGKISGRGVYICDNAECFAKAKKAKKFELGLETKIPEEIYETLSDMLEKKDEK